VTDKPKPAPRVTIRDVAREAQVGVVTVSRALNDQPGVSQETRERIKAHAARLGYRANRHARFLKLASSRTIALMMKGIDNPFFQQMLDTMETAVRDHDHWLSVVKVPHYADEVDEAIKLVHEDAVGGLIFLGGNFTHEAGALARIGVPYVLSTIGAPLDADESCSSVSVDDFAEAHRAVSYLAGLGHRQIALLGVGSDDESVGLLRSRGYRAALAEAGIEPNEALVRAIELNGNSPYSFDYGYQQATELLAEQPEVTAIFAVADVMAIGALKAAHDWGLQVPQDLSIVGFDGIPVGRFVHPTLTTLVQPAEQIAQLTCQMLFEQMAGRPPRRVLLGGELRTGGSTAPPRSGPLPARRS
jgi:DNA-binding LacI/PurR family transcriptional regulator